jgi:site-specific DNA-methyltransferase (adenine-specific)
MSTNNNNITTEKIYNDCFEMFSKIPDNSIDMVLTDPPYFLDRMDQNWNEMVSVSTNSHIKNVPLGMKFKPEMGKDFELFMDKISKEVFRVLKPGGFYLAFSYPRLFHRITNAAENSGLEIRDALCWCYTLSQVKAFSQERVIKKDDKIDNKYIEEFKNLKTPQLKSAFEPILFATKPREGRYIDNYLQHGVGLMDCSVKTGISSDKFPTNVLTTGMETGNADFDETFNRVFLVNKPRKEKWNTHTTIKPLSLCQHLIELFTKKGAIVVDPFLGSGTTALAAQNCGRKWIGAEQKEVYRTIIKQRTIIQQPPPPNILKD